MSPFGPWLALAFLATTALPPKAVIGRSTVLRMPISRSRLGTLPLKSPEPMLSSKNCSNFQEDHGRSRLHSKNKNLLCEM
jgi:hypothetical protein